LNLAATADPCAGITDRELVLHGDVHANGDDLEDDVVEFDLEENEDWEVARHLAMARFFSRKKFNARGLIEEMRVVWGLHTLKPVQVLGDNRFLIEFDSDEVKQRVMDGGPWRHKGDTITLVSYDGLSPPSSVVMNCIGLWAWL
jgi:hypothetical protein